jgi:hypothetical protein
LGVSTLVDWLVGADRTSESLRRRIIIDKKPYIRDDRVEVRAPYARPFVLLSGETNPADV